MSIPETINFDKEGQAEAQASAWPGQILLRKLFLSLLIILVATLAFGVGRLTGGEESQPIRVEYDPSLANVPGASLGTPSQTAAASAPMLQEGSVVGSTNGSKYHYPHCPGAKQIKEGNKVVFSSPKEAESSGYTLAANCTPR